MLGAHISLIFCQIQVFLHAVWKFWSSLLLQCFSRRLIILVLLFLHLQLPYCFLDFISSGHDYVMIRLNLLHNKCFCLPKTAAKKSEQYCRRHPLRHWQHRRHRRLCGRRRHVIHFDGWVSIPPAAPNIYHQVSALLVNDFISLHDPSQIVQIGQIFPVGGQDNNQGVVTIPFSLASTCDDVHCFSGRTLTSCVCVSGLRFRGGVL